MHTRGGRERDILARRERRPTSAAETGHCSLRVTISLDISAPDYAHTLRYTRRVSLEGQVPSAGNFPRMYRTVAAMHGDSRDWPRGEPGKWTIRAGEGAMIVARVPRTPDVDRVCFLYQPMRRPRPLGEK